MIADQVAALHQALAARARRVGLTDMEIREATGPLARTAALAAAQAHRKGALLLLGPPGTGKTLAATWWLLEPMMRLDAWTYTMGDWVSLRHYEPTWVSAKALSRVKQYDTREVEKLFSVRRLVVDDLGQEYLDKAGFLASLIDEVVSERHRREKPTVLTGNLSLDEFEQRYGMRIIDRVRAAGGCVVCDGDTMRGSKAARRDVRPAFRPADVEERLREIENAQRAETERQYAEQRERTEQFTAARAAIEEARTRAPVLAAEPMTAEQVAARKAELQRQSDEWRARNPEPTT